MMRVKMVKRCGGVVLRVWWSCEDPSSPTITWCHLPLTHPFSSSQHRPSYSANLTQLVSFNGFESKPVQATFTQRMVLDRFQSKSIQTHPNKFHFWHVQTGISSGSVELDRLSRISIWFLLWPVNPSAGFAWRNVDGHSTFFINGGWGSTGSAWKYHLFAPGRTLKPVGVQWNKLSHRQTGRQRQANRQTGVAGTCAVCAELFTWHRSFVHATALSLVHNSTQTNVKNTWTGDKGSQMNTTVTLSPFLSLAAWKRVCKIHKYLNAATKWLREDTLTKSANVLRAQKKSFC